MITDQDVEKLKGVFVTKEDAKAFAMKDTLADLRLEVGELHDKFDVMSDKMDYLVTGMDTLTGKYQDSPDEHHAGAEILARHDRQINALATATGVILPE